MGKIFYIASTTHIFKHKNKFNEKHKESYHYSLRVERLDEILESIESLNTKCKGPKFDCNDVLVDDLRSAGITVKHKSNSQEYTWEFPVSKDECQH